MKQPLIPDAPAEAALPDTDAKPKRISVMFYVADERNGPIEVQTGALKGPSGEGSSRVFGGGRGANEWQLRVASSSKLALTNLRGCHTIHLVAIHHPDGPLQTPCRPHAGPMRSPCSPHADPMQTRLKYLGRKPLINIATHTTSILDQSS